MINFSQRLRSAATAALLVISTLAGCGGGGGGGGDGGGGSAPAPTPVPAADAAAPTVLSTLPAADGTGAARTVAVSVTFSEAMDCATVNATTFTVSGGPVGITGAVACTGTSASFTPANALDTNTTYTATLSTGARDVAGNALAAAKSWTFSTLAARVVFGETGNLYAASEAGGAVAVVADTLDFEQVPYGITSYDASSTEAGSLSSGGVYVASDRRPMVQNGRVVYELTRGNGTPDIYAANLDGTQRTPLAATANAESAFALVGDRLIYSSSSATAFTTNVRSVRLDGGGDMAITSITTAGQHARAIGFTGERVIFTGPGGTFISNADSSNRVTLWNQEAHRVLVSGTRLLLTGSAMAAVNTDGTGFISLTTQANLAGQGGGFSSGSLMHGIAAGRVFYNSVDQSTTPVTYRLHSVGLDGANPLVLASSTTAYPYVMARAGTKLIVSESGTNVNNVVSYDIAQANSRTLLLANHNFMLLAGGRVLGSAPWGTGNYAISSVNPDGTAVATLAQGAIPVSFNQLARLTHNQIAYKKAAANGQIEGYVVNLNGSGTTPLTTAVAGDKELVDISGDRLIFESYAAGTPTATRNLHSVLLTGAGGLDYATTAADERYLGKFGNKLLFTSTAAGATDLKLVPVAGGAAVQLQTSPNAKSFVGAY